MPLPILGGTKLADTGFEVANSCRFNDGDSPSLHKSFSSASRTTYTFSAWVKLGAPGVTGSLFYRHVDDNNYTRCFFESDVLKFADVTSGADNWLLITTRKFRDHSAWYHSVVVCDTTNGTAGNRQRIYVNGVEETAFSTETNSSTQGQWGVDGNHYVGTKEGSAYFFDGYMAEVCYIDGTALTPTSFGEYNEDSPTIWQAKDVSGLTFGTNGFYLDFEASDNLGNDANGGTDLTEANLAAADQATDTPTNSFATLNPLYKTPNSLNFSEGNCQIQGASGNGGRFAGGTFCPDAGKWYMEIKVTVSGSYPIMGIIDSSSDIRENSAYFVAADSGTNQSGFAIFSNDDVYHNNDNTFDQWQTYATNDIIGLALDMDASTPTITFLKNNGSSEAFTTEAPNSGHYIFPAIGNYMQAAIAYCNFGGCSSFALTSAESDANGYGNFEYAPPSGYLAMCSKNIGENS